MNMKIPRKLKKAISHIEWLWYDGPQFYRYPKGKYKDKIFLAYLAFWQNTRKTELGEYIYSVGLDKITEVAD